MTTQRMEIAREFDETGEPVEFTWDLFPIVDCAETSHLDEHGLAKPGTRIREGMILVGRIGKTREFDPARQPSDLEIHGLPPEELRARFGHMWRDYSIYVTDGTSGVVTSAALEETPNGAIAVIELATDGNGHLALSAAGAKETGQ